MLLLILITVIGLVWLVASVLGFVLSCIATVMFAALVIGIAVLIGTWAFNQDRQSGHWQS